MSTPNPHATIAEIIRKSKSCVCLSGAGISTESGIPDFRDPKNGLWAKYQPEIVANIEVFLKDPTKFWGMAKKIAPNLFKAKPNKAHLALANLERMGLLKALITQNVDGLHQKAGSRMVLEIHGNVFEFECVACRGSYSYKRMLQKIKAEKVLGPTCDACGAPLKPNIVLFGENLPRGVWLESVSQSEKADVFLVCGSSLNVEPACMLPEIALKHGAKVIILNKDITMLDEQATAIIREPLSKSLDTIYKHILRAENGKK